MAHILINSFHKKVTGNSGIRIKIQSLTGELFNQGIKLVPDIITVSSRAHPGGRSSFSNSTV
jgi:hypothetical protein